MCATVLIFFVFDCEFSGQTQRGKYRELKYTNGDDKIRKKRVKSRARTSTKTVVASAHTKAMVMIKGRNGVLGCDKKKKKFVKEVPKEVAKKKKKKRW